MNDTKAIEIIKSQLGESVNGYNYFFANQLPSSWWFGLLGPFSGFLTKFFFIVTTESTIELIEYDMGYNFKQRTSISLVSISKIEIRDSWLTKKINIITNDNRKNQFVAYEVVGGIEHQKESLTKFIDFSKRFL